MTILLIIEATPVAQYICCSFDLLSKAFYLVICRVVPNILITMKTKDARSVCRILLFREITIKMYGLQAVLVTYIEPLSRKDSARILDMFTNIPVLLVSPVLPSLLQDLEENFQVHRLWLAGNPSDFLKEIGPSIQGIVSTFAAGISDDLMAQLPNLKIIAF